MDDIQKINEIQTLTGGMDPWSEEMEQDTVNFSDDDTWRHKMS